MQIDVNGDKYQVAGLQDNEIITISVAESMELGSNNTISLKSTGKPLGSATVVISD